MIMKASISIVEADDTKKGFDNIIIIIFCCHAKPNQEFTSKSPGNFLLKIFETLIVSISC